MDWKLLLLLLLINFVLLADSRPNRTRLRRPNLRRRINGANTSTSSTDQDLSIAGSASISTRTRLANANKVSKSTSSTSSSSPGGKLLVCYYTNWSQYRPKVGKFVPEDIPADLCTHVIFAFGWLKKGKLSSFESNDETKDGKIGLYDRINALKKANSKLKTLLAIGGWSFGTQKFKEMSATRYTRQTFIFSAISYLRERNFDGLDIDWEYPKGSEDKVNYIALLKDLHEAFTAEAEETGKPVLLLSAAVPVGPDSIRGGYDVPAVNKYLDFINLMAYDFHGKWESQTGHNAPLFAPSSDSAWRKQLSVSHAAETWVQLGASREKLIIGMPTYGRTFTLSDRHNYSVNVATKGGGTAGVYTKEGGFLAYYEICEILQSKTAQYIWDDEMKVPYLVQDDQWVGFDDERSIRNKMKWLLENKFGGAMVWTVDMDDFSGTVCSTSKNKYPLVTVMSEELFGAKRSFKDTDWSKVSPGKKAPEKPQPIAISVKDVLNRKRSTTERPSASINEETSVEDGKSRPGAVVCYFTEWSFKRGGVGKFSVDNIDPKLCSHIIYAFAGVKDSKISANSETVSKLVKLKEKNDDLKVLVSIGGWQHGAKLFKDLTSNIYRRNQFVYNTLEYLREVELDGLDIDWEFPKGDDDKEAHLDLVRELRMAFEGEAKSMKLERLILTVAVSGNPSVIQNGYATEELSKYVDYFNIMTYDYHGQWESVVGHNSPLFGIDDSTDHPLTVSNGIKIWAKEAPKEKLLVGLPTYGRTFTLKNAEKFDIGAGVSGPGKSGPFTKEDGFLAYYEVCDYLHSDNTTLVWDNEQMVPFAYNDLQWVGFDDERSFKTKIDWLKDENIGGVMLWSLDLDDFKGASCGTKYPLLKTVSTEMEGYRVPLTYEGPLETSYAGKKNKKDPNEITCAEEDGHISYHQDKADCTKYYMCEGERKHHMPCPAQLVFNLNENVCDWPENVEGCQNWFTSGSKS